MKTKKFKIAIDISPLSDGNSIRGVGYYTKNLVAAMQHEIKTNPDYRDMEISLIKNYKLKIKNFDLIHYPYFDPFYLTLPQTKTPFIVTVHDLIPLELKKLFPVGIKGYLKWLVQSYRLKKAQYILSPTHTAKYSIHDILKYPKDKIFTTYEAADKSFKSITNKKLLDSVKSKYNLPDKFVLFVGDLNRNKNIRRLVLACQEIHIPLIIAGGSAVKKTPVHPWTIDIKWVQDNQSPYLKSIGFVADQDLPAVYTLAAVYCQPSLSEGFGLPLLQAMQCGTPTCYSQRTALAEISDYSGISFDPYSINDIAQKLLQIINDKKLSAKLVQKGLARAKTFSWQLCAFNTLSVYRLVALNAQK